MHFDGLSFSRSNSNKSKLLIIISRMQIFSKFKLENEQPTLLKLIFNLLKLIQVTHLEGLGSISCLAFPDLLKFNRFYYTVTVDI